MNFRICLTTFGHPFSDTFLTNCFWRRRGWIRLKVSDFIRRILLFQWACRFSSEFSVTSIKGEGGFGCVFETFNKLDNWIYAVKRVAVNQELVLLQWSCLRVRFSQMERALREVRALAQLTHAGIVHYNASWIEQPPEGWQVRNKLISLFFVKLCKRKLEKILGALF